MYQSTSLRPHARGRRNAAADVHLTEDVTLVVEHGIGAKLDVIPFKRPIEYDLPAGLLAVPGSCSAGLDVPAPRAPRLRDRRRVVVARALA
jgi:hypothetical protein